MVSNSMKYFAVTKDSLDPSSPSDAATHRRAGGHASPFAPIRFSLRQDRAAPAPPPDPAILATLHPPSLWSRAFLTALLRLGAFLAVLPIIVILQPLSWQDEATGLGGLFVLLAGLASLLRAIQRARRRQMVIIDGGDHLLLPREWPILRDARLADRQITALALTGQGGTSRLIIEDRRRRFDFPIASFTDPRMAARLVARVKSGVLATPDGAARWQAVTKCGIEGQRIAAIRPVVTLLFVALLLAAFLVQRFLFDTSDLFNSVIAGANLPSKLWHGEWRQLVTANFQHLDFTHFAGNLILFALLGVVTERQIGRQRFLLLILFTGLCSQTASALSNHFLSSIGWSGVVFGLISAQLVLSRRFSRLLPLSCRFQPEMLLIGAILMFCLPPLISAKVDIGSHVGGLVAGALAALLFYGRGGGTMVTIAPRRWETALTASLAMVWCVAVGITAFEATTPNARGNAQSAATDSAARIVAADPVEAEAIAWVIASDPTAGQALIDSAAQLAESAVIELTNRHGIDSPITRSAIGVWATLRSRQGDDHGALTLLDPVFRQAGGHENANPLAHVLDRLVARQGPWLDPPSEMPMPRLSLASRDHASYALPIDIAVPHDFPTGARLYALLETQKRPIGLLTVAIPPLSAAPRSLRVVATADDKLDLTDADMVLAFVDMTGCACGNATEVSARIFGIDPIYASLP